MCNKNITIICLHRFDKCLSTILDKIYGQNAQYQQKKPTPQANENHCLRPFVEKQVFRTWLRLKT